MLNLNRLKKEEIIYLYNHRCKHHHRFIEIVHPNCLKEFLENNQFLQERIGFLDIECVVPGTLILTKQGLKPIENIKVGELVLTHKNRWQKVKKIFKRKINSKVVEIGLSPTFPVLTTTTNHPFLVAKIKEKKFSCRSALSLNIFTSESWVKAIDLDIKKHLVYSLKNEECWKDINEIYLGRQSPYDRWKTSNIPEKIEVDDDLLVTIGLFLGDGYCSDNQVSFFPNKKDSLFIEIIKRTAQKIGAYNLSIKKERNIINMTICNRRLAQFFKQFYNKNKEKYLPLKWLNLPTERFMKIIYGFALADGTINKNKFRISNTSEVLIRQIITRLSFTKYHFSVYKSFRNKKNIKIGTKHIASKKPAYGLVIHLKHKRWHKAWDFLFYTIRRLKYYKIVNYKGYIYNLHIENDETFITNGIITHNTTGLNAEFDYIISYAIYDEVNKKILGRVLTEKEVLNWKVLDKKLMKEFSNDVKNFDRLVVYWGKDRRHDLPFLRSRCIEAKADFPLYKEIFVTDLYDICKNKLRLHRYRLENVCDFLNIPAKQHPLKGKIWLKAKLGDKKALQYVWQHNKEDVISMREVYFVMEKYARNPKVSI